MKYAAIQAAAARSGRNARNHAAGGDEEISSLIIRDAYELGVRDFGENYVQEFEGKYAAFGS